MKPRFNKIGLIITAIGVITLITGIILAITVGTNLVPAFLLSSVIANTVGVALLRAKNKQ